VSSCFWEETVSATHTHKHISFHSNYPAMPSNFKPSRQKKTRSNGQKAKKEEEEKNFTFNRLHLGDIMVYIGAVLVGRNADDDADAGRDGAAQRRSVPCGGLAKS